MTGMGVRLVVVDDHRLHAEALASALKLRGHRVLAAAAPVAGAAELVVSRAPEVCLLGTAAPDGPGSSTRSRGSSGSGRRWPWWCSAWCRRRAGSRRRSLPGRPGTSATTSASRGRAGPGEGQGGEAAVAPQLLQGAFAELLHPSEQPDDEGSGCCGS